jgi:O-antigen/teichoic acid export membrane protein
VQGDSERWQAAFGKLLRLSSATAFPVFWGMCAIAPTAFPVLLGTKWNSAIVPFMLFCAILPLRMSHSLTGTVLVALGRADLSFGSVLVWAIILSPAFFFGAHFGMVGVAASWAVGFPVVYGLTIWMICYFLKVPLSIMLAPMTAPASAAALCAGVVVALQLTLDGRVTTATYLPLQVILGALAYLASLRFLAPTAFAEIFDLVARVIGRGTNLRAA